MADPCQTLEQHLLVLQQQRAALSHEVAQDFAEAGPGQKPAIIAEHKKEVAELDAQVAKVKAQLEECLSRRDVVVAGSEVDGLEAFDVAVQKFMHANHIRAGQLTILKGGIPLLMHAYTFGDKSYPRTKPSSLFRIASCSKAFTCAAIQQLYDDNAVMSNTPVFPFLAVEKPAVGTKQDARVDSITVQQLVDHQGGWNCHSTVGSVPGIKWDPVFKIREIAKALGVKVPTKRQIAAFMYGQPLQFAPGTQTLKSTQGASYSNVGYLLLGLVVEQASGMSYIDYVRNVVLDPLGLEKHIFVAPMLGKKNPLEVGYDDPGVGPTALDASSTDKVPYPYGGEGFVTELMDSGGGLMTTATTLALFSRVRATWGLGGRAPGMARSGGMAGTSSLMASRLDDVDYAYVFNTRHFVQSGDPLKAFGDKLENLFQTVKLPQPTLHLAPA